VVLAGVFCDISLALESHWLAVWHLFITYVIYSAFVSSPDECCERLCTKLVT
jgi:hypothetical protein